MQLEEMYLLICKLKFRITNMIAKKVSQCLLMGTADRHFWSFFGRLCFVLLSISNLRLVISTQNSLCWITSCPSLLISRNKVTHLPCLEIGYLSTYHSDTLKMRF